MSSPDFEAFVIRVLTNPDELERFLASPESVARAAGLTPHEASALAGVDRAGLLMTAESLRRKREAANARQRRHGLGSRLFGLRQRVKDLLFSTH